MSASDKLFTVNLTKLQQRYRRTLRNYHAFLQRGRRGWADTDVWDLDGYIARVLSQSIAHLAETDHGYPGYEPWDTPEKWKAHLLDLSERLTAWDKDFFSDKAFKATAAAFGEAMAEVFGHLWD
jgi:hypothetical protein